MPCQNCSPQNALKYVCTTKQTLPKQSEELWSKGAVANLQGVVSTKDPLHLVHVPSPNKILQVSFALSDKTDFHRNDTPQNCAELQTLQNEVVDCLESTYKLSKSAYHCRGMLEFHQGSMHQCWQPIATFSGFTSGEVCLGVEDRLGETPQPRWLQNSKISITTKHEDAKEDKTHIEKLQDL